MSRKSALEFAPTSFASSSALLGPLTRWSATASLAATYRACVVLYPDIRLNSSCLGDSIDRECLPSLCLGTVVKTDYPAAFAHLNHISKVRNYRVRRVCCKVVRCGLCRNFRFFLLRRTQRLSALALTFGYGRGWTMLGSTSLPISCTRQNIA